MKELPKVFENTIKKNIHNTQEVFYGNDRQQIEIVNKDNILKKINQVFLSPNHVYKSKVKLNLKNGLKEKVIVGKTNKELITINGELIKIADIIDIEKI